MSDTPSKKVIRELMSRDDNIRCTGFAKAMSELLDASEFLEACRRIRPDGYAITDDEVILYEVADTHPIRQGKASHIAVLADFVDEAERLLRVVVLDYTGNIVADVPGWAYASNHTDEHAPDNCMDLTPAAKAAYRESHALAETIY